MKIKAIELSTAEAEELAEKFIELIKERFEFEMQKKQVFQIEKFGFTFYATVEFYTEWEDDNQLNDIVFRSIKAEIVAQNDYEEMELTTENETSYYDYSENAIEEIIYNEFYLDLETN